jgi:GNAT superfamily N-acetyltransferase
MDYRRFHLDNGDLAELITCYQHVFATPPWSEWRRCANDKCDKHWGIQQRAELSALNYRHCGRVMLEFWPRDQVLKDLRRELSIQGASCWVAFDQGRMVGFTHGYPVALTALDQHLGLAGVADAVVGAFGPIGRVAYQDELGVVKDYRGQGIAHELVRRRLADFRAQGLKVGVVRTMSHPPSVTYLWNLKQGYLEVGSYGDDGGRVVMARSLDGLA